MEPKDIISPLQHWLLAHGRCVGCGRLLGGEKRERKNGIILVNCQCRRVFVYQADKNSYRRALFEEAGVPSQAKITLGPVAPSLELAGSAKRSDFRPI